MMQSSAAEWVREKWEHYAAPSQGHPSKDLPMLYRLVTTLLIFFFNMVKAEVEAASFLSSHLFSWGGGGGLR